MRTSLTATTIALLLIGLFTVSCGSGMYVNTEYRLPPPSQTVLAIFPPESPSKLINDALAASFANSGMKQVLYPGELIKRLKLTSYFHAKIRTGKESDSLRTLLDDKHYQYLATTLSPATLLLVPIELKYTGTPASTYIDYSFKLYDLQSGILLYRDRFEERTTATGEQGERELLRRATDQMARQIAALFQRN